MKTDLSVAYSELELSRHEPRIVERCRRRLVEPSIEMKAHGPYGPARAPR